jgi:hypothetical protein
MNLTLILLADFLLSLAAPVVTLFYRGGWFNTPDDPVSPRGQYEPFMQKLQAKVGPWWSDWWWLGVRNKAYGFSYAMKPAIFKGLHYSSIPPGMLTSAVKWSGPFLCRIIDMLGYSEKTCTLVVYGFPVVTLIYGYRLRPILDEVLRNAGRSTWDVPHRQINMDARPILSIRFGYDD